MDWISRWIADTLLKADLLYLILQNTLHKKTIRAPKTALNKNENKNKHVFENDTFGYFYFKSFNFSKAESCSIAPAQLMLVCCGGMLMREVANAEWIVSIKWHTCYCFCFDRTAGILRCLIWLLPCQRCTSNWCLILFLSSYWHTKRNSSYRLLKKKHLQNTETQNTLT